MYVDLSLPTELPLVSEGTPWTRGNYNALLSAYGGSARSIKLMFLDALPPEFCEFDRKKRGSSLNVDLYGYDPEQEVAVFQVRLAYRRSASNFLSTRKSYVLVGRNEITKAPFRYPVSSNAVRAAITAGNESPIDVVRAAQKWMWKCTSRQLSVGIRQGDVLLVQERGVPVGEHVGVAYEVGGSHTIKAEDIRCDEKQDRIFALRPALTHTKGQHEPVAASAGWYSVRVAREADAWDFSQRVGD
jgi:hypothetical protein